MRLINGIFIGTLASITCANAATVYPSGGVYSFTGAVAIASAPECPYATKASLAGYTAFGVDKFQYFNGARTVTGTQFRKGPALIFSPGGNAPKALINLNNIVFFNGATSASGAAQLTRLPSTDQVKGTYNFTPVTKSDKSFSATLTLTLNTLPVQCSTTYNLDFTKGVPSKLLNLL